MKALVPDVLCGECCQKMSVHYVSPTTIVCRNELCSEYCHYYDVPSIALKRRVEAVPASISYLDPAVRA